MVSEGRGRLFRRKDGKYLWRNGKMKISASSVKIGGEVDFGNWGTGWGRFRISLRWNKETVQYEVYKFFFRGKREIVVAKNQSITEIVKKACDLANKFAREVFGEDIYHDVAVEE